MKWNSQPGKADLLRLHRPENCHAMSDSDLRHVRQSCETLPGRVVGRFSTCHELPLIAELLKLLRREAAVRRRVGVERIEDARGT